MYEGNQWHILAGRVVHVAMDDKVLTSDPTERMKALRLMYNIRGMVNPVSQEIYGPNTLGLIKEVIKP